MQLTSQTTFKYAANPVSNPDTNSTENNNNKDDMPHFIEEFKEQRRLHRLILYKRAELRKLLRLLQDITLMPSEAAVVFDNIYELNRGDPYAEPTLYDGIPVDEIDPQVKLDLGRLIAPSSSMPRLPAVPNFFIEIKDPEEHPKLLFDRALYHGCLGARAMSRLRNYRLDKPIYDGCLDTFSLTYDPETGELIMYKTVIVDCDKPDIDIDYRTCKGWRWNLLHNSETYENGMKAFRETRLLAQARRQLRVKEANAKARELANANANAYPEPLCIR